MNKYIRLLVVEDSEDDVLLIGYELKRNGYKYLMQRVEDAAGMTEALEANDWDAIVADYNLPQFSALGALQLMQQKALDLPFIVVSGTVGEETAVHMMHAGAHDYIMKSNLTRLIPALERGIGDAAVRKERRQAEEELRRTMEELKRRNYELDSYVYKVSHDLRSPLCSILGLINLAEQEENLGTLREYIHLMENRVQKLDKFIQSILNHSKMLNAEVVIKAINPGTLIEECLDEYRYLPEAKRLRVTIQSQGSDVFYNDEFRVMIVLHNLIANAIKYTHPDRPENKLIVQVDITPREATISIEDNGIGIDPEHVPHVFNMFYRATNKSEGSGLGLYIVQQTVQQVGGRIDVASKAGVGTTFTVVFPNVIDDTVLVPAVTPAKMLIPKG